MVNNTELSAVLADTINHLKYGQRIDGISEDAYEWVIDYVSSGIGFLDCSESVEIDAKEVAEITYSKVEGEFS